MFNSILSCRKQDFFGVELSHISEFRPNGPAHVPLKLNDKELRHFHIKILNYLSNQFDMQTGKFEEVNFCKIVKECRVGKKQSEGIP